MAELRSRSPRASITPTSFVNQYEWGNLKGDPVDWMRRYFDAHVYLANWCACLLLLRVPRDAIDARTLRAYASDSAFTVEKTNTHWILEWALQESENYDRFGMEDGKGWMGRLTSLRDELLRGDLRPLYLGWLAGVSAAEVDEDAVEPPRPPGLSRLTAAQQALAEFLEIGPDLLTAAGLLVQQASEQPIGKPIPPRRAVAEIQKMGRSVAASRKKQEAAQYKKAEAERQAKRDVYLRTLAADFDRCWQAADERAERGIASAYDEVQLALVDLADAYTLCASRADFDLKLAGFMARHGKRGALARRLSDAKLWKKS